MRRIVMLLTVVALMMVMLAMSVAPAFAATFDTYGCRTGSNFYTEQYFSGGPLDHNGDGITCGYYNFNTDKWRDADNNANKVLLG